MQVRNGQGGLPKNAVFKLFLLRFLNDSRSQLVPNDPTGTAGLPPVWTWSAASEAYSFNRRVSVSNPSPGAKSFVSLSSKKVLGPSPNLEFLRRWPHQNFLMHNSSVAEALVVTRAEAAVAAGIVSPDHISASGIERW